MSDPSRLCSPKSSPRGSRSPAYPRQDSTGTLKTTITLGKNPSIVHSGPFYLMKEPPVPGNMSDKGRVAVLLTLGLGLGIVCEHS